MEKQHFRGQAQEFREKGLRGTRESQNIRNQRANEKSGGRNHDDRVGPGGNQEHQKYAHRI